MPKKKLIEKKEPTFEENKKIEKLKMLLIIVKKGHGIAINDLLLENGAALTNILFAEGTKEKYVVDIFGGEEKNKEAVLSIVPEGKYEKMRNALEARFNVSQAAKGTLITFDIKSMAGVLAYKFLSDYGRRKDDGK